MDHLVYLPAGDAALTRRAQAASRLSAVVVRFSRARKRSERQGILVEEEGLASAEQQCLADEEARARRRERDAQRRAGEDLELQERFAQQIAQLLPGCPEPRAKAIARHAAARGSGRVGRSAAGRAVDPSAVAGRHRLGPPSGHRLRRAVDDGRRPRRRARTRARRRRPDARTLASRMSAPTRPASHGTEPRLTVARH